MAICNQTNGLKATGEGHAPLPGFCLRPFDFHAHSSASDGTDSPAELVRLAKDKGLAMVALTDHDSVAGVPEALSEGKRIGIRVVAGVELNVQHDCTLHILGLGVDIQAEKLTAALEFTRRSREGRNALMLERLRSAGMDVEERVRARSKGALTRLHMAVALTQAGFAKTTDEAFSRYLVRGRTAYVQGERIDKQSAIDAIHQSGGIAVLAHPCKLRCEPDALVRELVALGLDGIEAYYPSSSEKQRDLFLTMARHYGLIVSSGSDYHGANREEAELGSAFCHSPHLVPIFKRFME